MTTWSRLAKCAPAALGLLIHLPSSALGDNPGEWRDATIMLETHATSAPAYLRSALQGVARAPSAAEALMLIADQSTPDEQCDCHTEAMKWHLLGAEQGQAGAQYNLGLIYATGKGVPQDYAEAIKWYRLAAEQGHTEAQYNLGLIYAKGEGASQDLVQAYLWLDLAAHQDREAYAKTLEQTASIMSPAQIEEAQRLAAEWLAKHPQ